MLQKDLKIGLIVGLVIAAAVVLKIATNPRLSPQARLEQIHDNAALQEDPVAADDAVHNEIPQLTPVSPVRQDFSQITDSSSRIIEGDNPQINNLKTISSGVIEPATVSPVPNSPENAPPAVADFSQSGQAEKLKTLKSHIVQKGETLSAISSIYYGTPNKWKKIFDANRGTIKDPNKVNQGIKLIIPD